MNENAGDSVALSFASVERCTLPLFCVIAAAILNGVLVGNAYVISIGFVRELEKFAHPPVPWYLLFVRVPSHISGRRILSHLPGFLLILGDVNPSRMADFCLD